MESKQAHVIFASSYLKALLSTALYAKLDTWPQQTQRRHREENICYMSLKKKIY